MKKRDIMLLTLLVSTLLVGSIQTQADDNPAVFNNLWFSHTNATIGDVVTVYLDISDTDGFNYLEVGIYSNISDPNNYDNYVQWISLTADGTVWSGTFEITQYYPLDVYVLEIYYQDNAGNYDYLIHNTDFLSPSLFIYGTTQDNVDPILNSIWFGQTNVTAGNLVYVYANVSDDLSGVSSVYIDIYRPLAEPTDYYWDGTYITSLGLQEDVDIGLWVGIWDVNEYLLESFYNIPYVYLNDRANNYNYYEDYNFSRNVLVPPTIYVSNANGDGDAPVLNSFFFESSVISVYERQTITANITDVGSGFNYGWMTVAYNDTDGNVRNVGEAYVNSGTQDPATGLYKGDVQYYNFVPSNTTLFVSYVYLYDFAFNNDNPRNNEDFVSPTYWISSGNDVDDPTVNSFSISISPDEGVNDVGQEVIFTVTLDNNRSRYVSGQVYLEISGPEDFTVLNEYYGVSEYSSNEFRVAVEFTKPGDYELKAFTETDEGLYYETFGTWTVNERQVEQAITLNVDPSEGQSKVNETVEFLVKAESTFLHDMGEVTVNIFVESESGFSQEDSFLLNLPAQSVVEESYSILFPAADLYKIRVVLVDDIGAEWAFEFEWEVVERDGTITETKTDTDPVTSDTNSTSNSSGAPQIELPGFELPVALFSFTFLFVTSYIRRRKI